MKLLSSILILLVLLLALASFQKVESYPMCPDDTKKCEPGRYFDECNNIDKKCPTGLTCCMVMGCGSTCTYMN